MKFGRAPEPVVEPDAPAETAPVDLTAVPLRALCGEAARRGWVVLPAGAWDQTVSALEARAEAAEARLAEIAKRDSTLVDATKEFRLIGHLAGVELPRVVETVGELRKENVALSIRADRAEQEASMLAGALIADEFPDHVDDSESEGQ
jgi:hypothetical protein